MTVTVDCDKYINNDVSQVSANGQFLQILDEQKLSHYRKFSYQEIRWKSLYFTRWELERKNTDARKNFLNLEHLS